MKYPFDISDDALETVEVEIPTWRVLQGIASRMRDMADGERDMDLDWLRFSADTLANISSKIADAEEELQGKP